VSRLALAAFPFVLNLVLRGVTLRVNGLLAFGLEQRLCLDFNQGLLVVEEWILASCPSLRARGCDSLVGMSTDMTSLYHHDWVHDGVWCFTCMDWSSCGSYSLEQDFGWCLVWADNTDLGSGNGAGFRLGFTLDDGTV
jgi:hypothetical protein